MTTSSVAPLPAGAEMALSGAASSDGAEVVRCEATGSDGAGACMLQAANEERERE